MPPALASSTGSIRVSVLDLVLALRAFVVFTADPQRPLARCRHLAELGPGWSEADVVAEVCVA